MSQDKNMLTVETIGNVATDPGLFGAFDEVIEHDAQPTRWPGLELTDDGDKIVDAAELFHDHSLDPKVMPPHLLDQFRIVLTLDVDTTLPGNAGTMTVDPNRARCGSIGPVAGGRAGTYQPHGRTIEPESWP
jgi:hypothetical protein